MPPGAGPGAGRVRRGLLGAVWSLLGRCWLSGWALQIGYALDQAGFVGHDFNHLLVAFPELPVRLVRLRRSPPPLSAARSLRYPRWP